MFWTRYGAMAVPQENPYDFRWNRGNPRISGDLPRSAVGTNPRAPKKISRRASVCDLRTLTSVHCAYFVRCADGTLYAGYARDAREREKTHNTGRGARYTRARRPVALVYVERFRTKGAALKREYQLKQLSRAEKEALILRKATSRRAGRRAGRARS